MAEVIVRTPARESAEDAKPFRWALSPWARGFRQAARPLTVSRHVRRFCRPFEVVGREHASALRPPALIIANHVSHFDTVIVLSVLPRTLYARVAITAAADRFFTNKLKAAWHALRYNAYPIARGGGSQALAYSEWLLEHNWALLIFPEGRRSRTGELLPFHPGPTLLALRGSVPVLPVHIAGAADILRPGERWAHPAPVRVTIGEPVRLSGEESVPDATQMLQDAVRRLGERSSVLVNA